MPTTKNKKTRETREVPSEALRQKIGSCKFAAGDEESGKIPFSMLARSAEPVVNWYFGPIYHDFEGMKRRDSIATDYIHRDDEILGYADQFNVDEEGLHLAGALVPFADGDRASEVAHKQKAGVPYEASIDFTGDDIVIEEIGQGYTAEVNGRQVEGPCAIIREWSLRGVAICPHGMDSRTETRFSQTKKKTVIQLYTQSTMAKTSITGKKPASKLSTKAAAKPKAATAAKPTPATQMAEGDEEDGDAGDEDDAEEECDCEGEEDCDCDKKDDASEMDDDAEGEKKEEPEQKQSRGKKPAAGRGNTQFARDLKKFTDRFGSENGTKWFLEGKSYGDALDEHTKTVERQLAAKDAENAKLAKRLKAAKTGEEVPSDFSADGEDSNDGANAEGNPKFDHMGANMSKFASSLKLPGRRK